MLRPVHRFLLAAVGVLFAVVLGACQTTASPTASAPSLTVGTTTAAPVTTTEPTTTTTLVPTTTTVVPTTTTAVPTHHSTTKAKPRTTHAAPKKKSTGACGSGYYRNSDGVCVHRPAAAPTAPAGATAQCKDGTYSFSKHHSGTCSHHGGVRRWL